MSKDSKFSINIERSFLNQFLRNNNHNPEHEQLVAKIGNYQIPQVLCYPFYRFYKKFLSQEHSSPILPNSSVYSSVSSLFKRYMDFKDRTFSKSQNVLSSPVDGKIIVQGKVNSFALRNISLKGNNFNLRDKINPQKDEEIDRMNVIVLYLHPKDYHHFHSPVDFNMVEMSKQDDELLSMNNHVKSGFRSDSLLKNKRVILINLSLRSSQRLRR